ncbi:hypothetical protein ES703_61861 [subsurface metagenome]
MSKVAESDDYGGGINVLTALDSYVYAGGWTTNKVWQIDPTDMSKVAESDDYGGSIAALTALGSYVYAGGDTTQKVWQIDPTDMSKVAESDNYGGGIDALTWHEYTPPPPLVKPSSSIAAKMVAAGLI